MSNQLVVPMFHQYTKIEELKRFIPANFNRAILVVKEILDNACDEAEKTDYTVYIQFDRVNKRLTVKNNGIITEEALLTILDFSKRLTNRYLNKSYRRGAIGHGLKLAIMLSDIDNHPWIIKSNQKQFEITLKSRQAKDPKEVLSLVISEMPNNMINEVEITVPLFFGGNEEIDKVEDYIKNYIIANPHITFIYNNTKHSGIKVNAFPQK